MADVAVEALLPMQLNRQVKDPALEAHPTPPYRAALRAIVDLAAYIPWSRNEPGARVPRQ